MAAVNPSLPWVVSPGSVAGMVAVAALALEVIPVLTAEVASKVTLVAPPPPVVVEETRGGEILTSLDGGLHDPSLPSEPKAPEGSMAGTELGRPAASHESKVVEILSNNEVDTMAEPPVSPQELAVSLWELAVVRLEAGPSSGSSKGDLEWPFPEDPLKARFVLRDSREHQL